MEVGMRISDAVHGTVELTQPEARVVSTRAFQRLRGVKHLGLASLVFPGADFSRFAHGIGTLYVTGEILENLRRNIAEDVPEKEIQLYRMAALLHDVGHYPFSHTFERALKDFYAETTLLQPTGTEGPQLREAEDTTKIWLHEEVGQYIIERDDSLRSILEEESISVDGLWRTIRRSDPPRFANLISSDLDADRTDYLMRTARHTGLPYGNVDLPYLLSQIRVDKDGRICFTQKGMRAAEHLLLCRYFDYQQVSFHKTVAGFELVLNDAVAALLRAELLRCRPSDLQEMINAGDWYNFDDARILGLMRTAVTTADDRDRLVFDSILQRRPPKLVCDRELLGSSSFVTEFNSLRNLATKNRVAWEDEFGCPFYIWTQRGTSLTKIGSDAPISALISSEDETYDKIQQAVHILRDDGRSVPIQEDRRSLTSVLSNFGLFSLRVYALLPAERQGDRSQVAERVNGDLLGFLTQ